MTFNHSILQSDIQLATGTIVALLGFCGLGFMAYRKNAAVRFA